MSPDQDARDETIRQLRAELVRQQHRNVVSGYRLLLAQTDAFGGPGLADEIIGDIEAREREEDER